jgi:hypothetical protein
MSEDWQKLDTEKSARYLLDINPNLEPIPFSADSITIRTQRLPFYKGYELLELTDLSTIPAARKYAIYKPGDATVINWTNQPIYEVNEKAPIQLDERNVVAYVKFFFNYVRGRHGKFQIVEAIDDIRWQIEPPLQGRKVMQEMLAPVSVAGLDSGGTFHLDLYMVFKDSLFRTKVHVKKDGLVSMSGEELKIEGMPVLQDSAA